MFKCKFVYLPTLIASSIFLISGCVDLTPDYAPPTNVPTAKINITLALPVQTINSKVLVHGMDVCDVKQARLAATITNMDAIGVRKKEAHFEVPAGQPVSVSIPINFGKINGSYGSTVDTTVTWTQPLVTFTPEGGKSYEIEFTQFSATVYVISPSGASSIRTGVQPSSMNRSCRITSENQGNDKIQFFLKR